MDFFILKQSCAAKLQLISQICKFFFLIRLELCILKQKSRVREWKEGAHGCAAHRRQWIGRADVGIKSRRNGRRRSGVCQTPATAKKKKPDGFPRNGRYHEENVGCFIIHPTEPDPFLYDGRYY